jgi:hypothetical protein
VFKKISNMTKFYCPNKSMIIFAIDSMLCDAEFL